MSQVVVCGAVNGDYSVLVDRAPGPGETVIGSNFELSGGGKGANQACAIACLGVSVSLIASVGRDNLGSQLVQELAVRGVEVHLIVTDVEATGVALIIVDGNGENRIVVAPGVNRRVRPNDVERALIGAAARIVVGQSELGAALIEVIASQANTTGARFVLSLGPVVPVSEFALSLADPLIVNEVEARQILDEATLESPAELASKLLLATGARSVVITFGAKGALWCSEQLMATVEAAPTAVVDSTGAGDAFTGALVAALARGDAPDIALSKASSYAAQIVSIRGARPPLSPVLSTASGS